MRLPQTLIAAILAAVFAVAVHAAPAPGPELATVNTLDRFMQERFEKLDTKLMGMSRLPSTPEHGEFRMLRPDTKQEQELVRDLKAHGWEALFYVSGRSALFAAGEKPKAEGAAARAQFYRRVVSEPVSITGEKPAERPDQKSLLPHAVAAFREFKRKQNYEFTDGGWHVVARPIPASNIKCLKCHTKDGDGSALKLGDTVGVAFYAFAKR